MGKSIAKKRWYKFFIKNFIIIKNFFKKILQWVPVVVNIKWLVKEVEVDELEEKWVDQKAEWENIEEKEEEEEEDECDDFLIIILI